MSTPVINIDITEPTKQLTSIITTPKDANRRRPIILDGLNIGYAHGNGKGFSVNGILYCANFFWLQGFNSVEVMLPQHYKGRPGTETHNVLSMLKSIAEIHFTPSRKIKNIRRTCYCDRILLDHAYLCNGVVVSNDNFQDIYDENDQYKEIIEKRKLIYMFIGDRIFFPMDQYGQDYSNLYISNIVHFPAET